MAIIGTKLLNHNIIIFQMQHHITYNLVGQEVDSNDFRSTLEVMIKPMVDDKNNIRIIHIYKHNISMTFQLVSLEG